MIRIGLRFVRVLRTLEPNLQGAGVWSHDGHEWVRLWEEMP
jgi:hypothetical protein